MPKVGPNGNIVALSDEIDTRDLQSQIATQTTWLQDKLDDWESLSTAEQIIVLKRVVQVNVAMLKAWNFVTRKILWPK